MVLQDSEKTSARAAEGVQTGLSSLAIWNGPLYELTPGAASPIHFKAMPHEAKRQKAIGGLAGREGTG